MHVGIEGTAPGVEQGKELSLSVKEWSSSISHKVWVDTDIPHPVTYIAWIVNLNKILDVLVNIKVVQNIV